MTGVQTCALPILNVKKTSGVFLLDFQTEGFVIVPCDPCLDEMELPVSTSDKLKVKLGSSFTVEGDIVVVSNNLLPLGSLVYLVFCTSRYGWGWNNFITEANTGKGILFPKWIRFYMTWLLPLIVLYIFATGYYGMFFK